MIISLSSMSAAHLARPRGEYRNRDQDARKPRRSAGIFFYSSGIDDQRSRI
jgi:hypothetical protein